MKRHQSMYLNELDNGSVCNTRYLPPQRPTVGECFTKNDIEYIVVSCAYEYTPDGPAEMVYFCNTDVECTITNAEKMMLPVFMHHYSACLPSQQDFHRLMDVVCEMHYQGIQAGIDALLHSIANPVKLTRSAT